jgi:hypothetical protein
MIAGPRLTRIAGVFAVGLAALVVGTGQAFAGCSLAVGTSGANLTLSDPTDDLTGTTSVTLTGNGTVLTSTGLSVFAHSISLTITSEPVPTITGVSGGADHTSGSTGGGNILVINGANFLPQVTATLTGGACDGQAASYFYNDLASVNIGGTNASTIIVDSNSQIRVVVPQGIAGLSSSARRTRIPAPPAITATPTLRADLRSTESAPTRDSPRSRRRSASRAPTSFRVIGTTGRR